MSTLGEEKVQYISPTPVSDLWNKTAQVSRGLGNDVNAVNETVQAGAHIIIGDTHFSPKQVSSHHDYRASSLRLMIHIVRLLQDVKKQYRSVAVTFLGDIVGTKENTPADPQFRFELFNFFRLINSICESVTTVRGNHDFGENPMFLELEVAGFVTNPKWLDVQFEVSPGTMETVRYHLVNYGNAKSASFDFGNVDYQIALCHQELQIPGYSWYDGKDAVDATSLTNFKGLSLVVCGHLHEPWRSFETFPIAAGLDEASECEMFYPGSPARVARTENYNDCKYVLTTVQNGAVDVSVHDFGLWPASEEFIGDTSDDFDKHVNNIPEEESRRREALSEVFASLAKNPVSAFNVPEAIVCIAPSDEVKDVALNHYELAQNDLVEQ